MTSPLLPWPKPPFDPAEVRRRRGWLATVPVCAHCGEQINGIAQRFGEWMVHEKCLKRERPEVAA